MPDPTAVRSMFARIAGRYDLLNRVLSAGVDRSWRRRTVARSGAGEGSLVVDACCGTGDLAFEFARAGARVVGVDFTQPMLARAQAKRGRPGREGITFVQGDALALPVASGVADIAAVAFGLRNVADRQAGLGELVRVVRPGGRVLVLEFTRPPGRVLGAAYRLYFTRVLPRIGGVVSGDGGAYQYLPRSVLAWPGPEDLRREMEIAGLGDCGFELLTRGIACLHFGTVPAQGGRP